MIRNKIFLILSFCLLSCIYEAPLEVVSITPDYNGVMNNSIVTVKFSRSIDVSTVESNVFIYGDNLEIKYTYCLEGKSLILKIENNEYSRYKLLISAQLKSNNGIGMSSDYISYFFSKSNFDNFVIEETYPKYNESISEDEPFEITFNKEISNTYIDENISISPAIAFYSEPDGCKLRIIPISGWNKKTLYTIKILNGLYSLSGEKLNKTYEFNHKLKSETEQPRLESVKFSNIDNVDNEYNCELSSGNIIVSGVGVESSITLVFSEAMDFESIINSVKFLSGLPFSIERITAYKYKIIPDKKFDFNKQYQLSIHKTAKDLNDNSLFNGHEICFIANSVLSSPLKINSVSFSTDEFLHQNEIVNITKSITHNVCVEFSEKIRPESIPENVYVSLICGDMINLSGAVKKFNWQSSNILTFEISALHPHNIYCLTFRGGERGIKSEDGKYINKDIKYYFKMEEE